MLLLVFIANRKVKQMAIEMERVTPYMLQREATKLSATSSLYRSVS